MTFSFDDLEVSKLFAKLAALQEDAYKRVKSSIKLEAALAKKAQETRQTADFWDDVFSGEATALKEGLANNTPFSPTDIANAEVQFTSILGTLLGAPPVVSYAGATSTDIVDNVNQQFDSAFASCGNAVSAVGVVKGIATIQARKIESAYRAATGTFALLTGKDPTLPQAVFVQALKNYIIKSTVQNLLLKQIEDEIININEAIADLTASDYVLNHRTVISAAIDELRLADNIIRSQIDNVLRKFPINIAGYDSARKHIDNVRDSLCGIDLSDLFGGLLSLDILKIAARLIYLEQLLVLLDKSDQETQRILINLGSFNTAFEDLTFFDDLFIPVLQLIRCRLGVTMADMRATMDTNKLFTFIIKEKAWCLELSIISAIMRAAKVFKVDINKTPLSVAGLDDVFNDLFLTVKNQNFGVTIASIQTAAQQYIRNVRYKMSYNVPAASIQTRGVLVNRLIKQRILENEKFGVVSNEKTLLVQGTILSGITILNKFLTTVDNVDTLGTASAGLREGNLAGLFKGELLKNAITTSHEKILSDIEEALIAAGKSLKDVGDRSMAAYAVFEDITLSESLFSDALNGFPEAHLREIVAAETPRYTIKVDTSSDPRT